MQDDVTESADNPENSSSNLLRSSKELVVGDAVAAIILTEDGRYLLQLRDDIESIWYPDHWGCFGGAVDEGEAPLSALRRELYEEIEFEPHEIVYFTRFDFDLTEFGMRRFYRAFYVISMTSADRARLVLHEGQAVEAFSGERIIKNLRMTPYDAFALYLHYDRNRIGNLWGKDGSLQIPPS